MIPHSLEAGSVWRVTVSLNVRASVADRIQPGPAEAALNTSGYMSEARVRVVRESITLGRATLTITGNLNVTAVSDTRRTLGDILTRVNRASNNAGLGNGQDLAQRIPDSGEGIVVSPAMAIPFLLPGLNGIALGATVLGYGPAVTNIGVLLTRGRAPHTTRSMIPTAQVTTSSQPSELGQPVGPQIADLTGPITLPLWAKIAIGTMAFGTAAVATAYVIRSVK